VAWFHYVSISCSLYRVCVVGLLSALWTCPGVTRDCFSCYGNSSLGSGTHGFILHVCDLFIPFCIHFTHILCRMASLTEMGGGGSCICEWAIHGPLNAGVITHYHHFDEILIWVIYVPVLRFSDFKWTCCLFCRFDLPVAGCVAICHCYCCVSLLWASSNMSGCGDKVTVRRFHNFAFCVTYVKCVQFLSARLSGRWRLILTVFSMKLASCHPSGACSSETAPRYLENLWTLDLIDLSSLNGFSIIYSFSV
jgi:hypothetical protein